MSGVDLPVVVVGGGIAGLACARRLHEAGRPVRVLDRGKRLGGRLAGRHVEGRMVDLGASYLTASDPAFRAVVEDWVTRGLAHPWTDTFSVAAADPAAGGALRLGATKSGPVRYGTPAGLRSLVEDLAVGLDVRSDVEVSEVDPGPAVDGEPCAAVVLAMPDPQALDLLSEALADEVAVAAGPEWQATIALAAGWDERTWPEVDGVFVGDSAVLTWIADDGRRRGDGAPVLVGHSTPALAAACLDEPERALTPMLEELVAVLGIDLPPRWSMVKRWSLARTDEPREAPFHLGEAMVGLCGDGWHAPSRVESAFLSGRALGDELVRRLA